MRKTIFSFVLLLLFFVPNLFSQEIGKRFDQYLPESITGNPFKLKSIHNNLETYAAIDPALIYFYIKSLESSQNVDSSGINWRDVFQKKLARAKSLQKEWAKLEQTAIKEQITPEPLAKKISSFYDKYDYVFSHQMVILPKVEIDENKLNFFNYLYLSENKVDKFNPQKDYKTLFVSSLQKMVDELNKKYEELNDLTPEEEINDFIIQANRYPFIFKNSYLKDLPVTTHFHIYQFLADYYKKDFINHNSIYLQISGLILPFSMDESFKTTDPFDSHYEYKYNIKIHQSPGIYLGFKWTLKEEFRPFSFININIGLPLINSYSNTFNDTILFNGTKSIQGLKFTGSYRLTGFRELSSTSMFSQITTPVYYYSDKLFFEAGVHYTFIKTSYKYDFVKDGDVSHPYSPEPPEYYSNMKETIDQKTTHHLFYPVLAINYYFRKNLNLRVDYLIPLQARISIGYYFNF